jgi:hypothetical protein
MGGVGMYRKAMSVQGMTSHALLNRAAAEAQAVALSTSAAPRLKLRAQDVRSEGTG